MMVAKSTVGGSAVGGSVFESSPISPLSPQPLKGAMQTLPVRGRTRSVLTEMMDSGSKGRSRLPVISTLLQIKKEIFTRGLESIKQARRENNQPHLPHMMGGRNSAQSQAHSMNSK
jgi:hypothetical protein